MRRTRFAAIIPIAAALIFLSVQPAHANSSSVNIASGKQISVVLLSDLGSRTSRDNDTFAVETTEDFYVHGKLILPKGTPGYGRVTHVKGARIWHAGGELTFVITRLVAPDGKNIAVSINGKTGDASRNTEHNGNVVGQYLMWGGLGVISKRGNDILITKGSQLHVYTRGRQNAQAVSEGTRPAPLDINVITERN